VRPACRAGTPSAADPGSALLHLAWIVPLLLLFFFLSSPRFRGDIAETRVRRLLAAGLERNRFTVFNDVVLPIGGGTTRINHVVVSRVGIFVIESSYVRGWISGTEVQDRWQQNSWGRSTRCDNPLHRNRRQVEALQRLLDYPSAVFHPLVVLVGLKGFRKRPPENVIVAESLLARIRKKTGQLLSPEQADHAIRMIGESRLSPAGGRLSRPANLLRLLLLLVLLAGLYLAFRDDLPRLVAEWERRAEQQSEPALFRPDGSRKSERELWEDSLVCAYSVDTGRCACYEPDGAHADLSAAECRALAERGSVLKQ
jgi:restriction system protein